MRRLLCLLLLAAAPAAAADPSAEVRGLDADYVRAYLASDVARFREILAEDFTCVLADGRLLDRDGFLRMAAAPPPVSGFRTDQLALRLYGDTAVATGRATYLRREGGPTQTRYTDVYVRRDGRWRMVSAQFTRLAP